MAWRAPLRLPLSCGDTGFGLVAVTSLGGAIVFGPLFIAAYLPAWTLWVVAGLAALWLVLLVVLARATWRARASDVQIDASGLAIIAGPLSGRRYPWPVLSARRIRVLRQGELAALAVGRDVIACTHDPAEAASLRALAATLTAGASDRAPDASLGPEVVKCVECGAGLVPADAASVACAYCGHEGPLPERVQHAAGAARAEAHVERAVASLLRWPRARRMNVWLAASFAVAALAWPAIAACALYVGRQPATTWLDLAVLFCCGLGAASTFPSLVSLAAAERRSFELLSARFAALPPPSPGEPYACRACGGPLPDPHGRSTTPAVAVCAYCEASNVVGLGLAREARDARTDAESLGSLARARIALRRRRRLRSVLPVVLLLATPWQLANAMFAELCWGDGSCQGEHSARWCVGGVRTSVRCDGPRGCARTGLRVYCDQSIAAEGAACLGPEEAAACSPDGASLLRCREGRSVLTSRCRGPDGCHLEQGAVLCDIAVAAEGEPCEGDTQSCAEDGRALLECRAGSFAVLHPTDTCRVAGGRMMWSGAYAQIGERCGEGGAACTADGRMLRCVGGRLSAFVDCRGPGGCMSEGTRIACDQSMAAPGDACASDASACSIDGAALLGCRDGRFVETHRCPGGCRVAEGAATCRLRR